MEKSAHAKYYELLKGHDQWKLFFGSQDSGFQGARIFNQYLVKIKKTNGGTLDFEFINPRNFNEFLSEELDKNEDLMPIVAQAQSMIGSGQMSKEKIVQFGELYEEMGIIGEEAIFDKTYPAALKKGISDYAAYAGIKGSPSVEKKDLEGKMLSQKNIPIPDKSHKLDDQKLSSQKAQPGKDESEGGYYSDFSGGGSSRKKMEGGESGGGVELSVTPSTEKEEAIQDDKEVEEGALKSSGVPGLEVGSGQRGGKDQQPIIEGMGERKTQNPIIQELTPLKTPQTTKIEESEDPEESEKGEVHDIPVYKKAAQDSQIKNIGNSNNRRKIVQTTDGERQAAGPETVQESPDGDTRMQEPNPQQYPKEGTERSLPKVRAKKATSGKAKKSSILKPIVPAGAGLAAVLGGAAAMGGDANAAVIGLINLLF